MNRIIKNIYRWMVLNELGELSVVKEIKYYDNRFLSNNYDTEGEAIADMDQFLYKDYSNEEYILVKSYIFYNKELA